MYDFLSIKQIDQIAIDEGVSQQILNLTPNPLVQSHAQPLLTKPSYHLAISDVSNQYPTIKQPQFNRSFSNQNVKIVYNTSVNANNKIIDRPPSVHTFKNVPTQSINSNFSFNPVAYRKQVLQLNNNASEMQQPSSPKLSLVKKITNLGGRKDNIPVKLGKPTTTEITQTTTSIKHNSFNNKDLSILNQSQPHDTPTINRAMERKIIQLKDKQAMREEENNSMKLTIASLNQKIRDLQDQAAKLKNQDENLNKKHQEQLSQFKCLSQIREKQFINQLSKSKQTIHLMSEQICNLKEQLKQKDKQIEKYRQFFNQMVRIEQNRKLIFRISNDLHQYQITINYYHMTEEEQLRKTILAQTDHLGTKQRFGLFSQPVTLAVGDDSQYKKKLHPRDQQGKPKTLQRNFQTSPNKIGQVNSSFFQPLGTLASLPDPYIDPARKLLLSERQAFNKGKNHQLNFVPASGRKTLANSSYTYLEQKQISKDPKSRRNSEGKVILEPRNITSNPMQKVDKTYFGFPKHMEEPYDRQKQLQGQRRKIAKSKQHQTAFKSRVYSPRDFNTERNVYGVDVELKQKTPRQIDFNVFPHQAPFKPSNPKRSGTGYFTPFPEYMPNPPKQKIRKPESKQKKQEYKTMVAEISKPSPSITFNPINMRRYVNHSFSRRF